MLERMWSKGNTHPLLVGMQTCVTTLEISVEVFKETGSQPTSRPSNSTIGNIPKRFPIILLKHLFNCVHSSTICQSENWKQPRCPSIEEWIKKVRHIYTLEFYSSVKINGILNFACKWMEMENNLLSDKTQTKKMNMVCTHS